MLCEYTKEITNSSIIFYYDISEDEYRIIADKENDHLIKLVKESLTMNLNNIIDIKIPKELSISDTKFVMMPVRTNYKIYGILGCQVANTKDDIKYGNNMHQIQFLSELMSITFERLYLEEVNSRLLISEEQNRIANEIHDGVLQRLFCLSCGIFALMRNMDEYSTYDIREELDFVRNTIDDVMKELRNKIYGLSWKKSGTNSFVADIKSYIEETKRLNDVVIPFSIIGNDELLTCDEKKALYRMICEGIGNAVRHGKAKNIDVNLNIDSNGTVLSIVDDGIGFDVNEVKENNSNGLGIKNLYHLSESLGGETKIDSRPGKGTKIEIIIPNHINSMRVEEAII